jgi:CHAT domain-containing protein
MVAGCPSTIGSRWDVDDGAAQQWMAAFYRSYTSRRASVAESRRDACLALLATKGKRDDYSAPRFWANWTLLGSDR